MVAISQYDDVYNFYGKCKGPSRVKGGMPTFDQYSFPTAGRGSGLVNVLVIDWDSFILENQVVNEYSFMNNLNE